MPQVVGKLELHAPAAAHAVADVLRVCARVAMSVNAVREPSLLETFLHEPAQIGVEASDVYVGLAFATMDGDGDIYLAPSGADTNAGTQAAPLATVQPEPERAPTPPAPDPTREQIRALMDRARQKIENHDPEGAEVDLEAALKLDPNNQNVREVLEKVRNRPRPPGPRPTR